MSRQSVQKFNWFGAGFMTAGVIALILVAVGMFNDNSSSSGDGAGASNDRAGTLTGSYSGLCPETIVDATPNSYCVLRASDNGTASVTVQLDAASEAGRTRYVLTCDYTQIKSVVTFRRQANLPWETLTDDRDTNPQCGTGQHLIWKYKVENYQPYVAQPNVLRARNQKVTYTIPSTNSAYGAFAFFYNAPSIRVVVVDLCGPNGDQPC